MKTSLLHHFLAFVFLVALGHLSAQSHPNSRDTNSPIYDLNQIYTDQYAYSLPRPILESFLSGKAFDYPVKYTRYERQMVNLDIVDLYRAIVDSQPNQSRIAVISAGSPGSGKTTVMQRHLTDAARQGKRFAYVDPDDVCLKGQTRTYLADIGKGPNTLQTRRDAYTKWRPASNAANHILLGNLIRDGVGFHFGTTSSSPMTYKFFEFLKEHGYRICILHVSAPDDVRWGSIVERDKTFVQTTEEDTREKGLLVPQRIHDTFMKYADEIEFYYREAVDAEAVLGARWIKEGDTSTLNGHLLIYNEQAYQGVKTIHNQVVDRLQRPELLWEEAVESNSHIDFPN